MKFALLFITMILCASCAKAGNMADSLLYDTQVNPEYTDIMDYTLGSEKADKEFAQYIQGFKEGGGVNTHIVLARANAHFDDMFPNVELSIDNSLHIKTKRAIELGAKKNLVKAHAHYKLADNFKINYKDRRELLEKHMTPSEIREAKQLAKIWRKQLEAQKN